MSLRIGIDVGGTNTDAVVLDGRTVVASTKSPTTEDVTIGIRAALTEVLADVDPADIDSVFIGTTHFINAIAQARGLERVALIRLATPPQSLLPMIDWPDRLRGVAIDKHMRALEKPSPVVPRSRSATSNRGATTVTSTSRCPATAASVATTRTSADTAGRAWTRGAGEMPSAS